MDKTKRFAHLILFGLFAVGVLEGETIARFIAVVVGAEEDELE